MKLKFIYIFCLLFFVNGYSQDSIPKYKWLRTGLIVGYASQNTFIKQEADYTYESKIFKFSNHFNFYRKNKNHFEILIEPSYYRSKHQMINYWFIPHTVENGDELREKYMKLKSINEYVLNVVQQNLALYDKSGEQHYDIISAFIKSTFCKCSFCCINISIFLNISWRYK